MENQEIEFDVLVKQLMAGEVQMVVADDESGLNLASHVNEDPQEAELAQLLVQLTQKYGKFNEDGEGVWAGYQKAKDNDTKDIGVKCSNCALYEGGQSCKIIAAPVEPDGKCRFAIIHNGIVRMSKKKNK